MVCAAVHRNNNAFSVHMRDIRSAIVCTLSRIQLVYAKNSAAGGSVDCRIGIDEKHCPVSGRFQLSGNMNRSVQIQDGGIFDDKTVGHCGFGGVALHIIVDNNSAARRKCALGFRIVGNGVHLAGRGVGCKLIVPIAEAIVFNGILCCVNRKLHVVQRFAHIFISRVGSHGSGDGNQAGFSAVRRQMTFLVQSKVFSSDFVCKANHIKQYGVAVQSGHNQLIFQSQISGIDNFERGQRIGATGLPQNLILRPTVGRLPFQLGKLVSAFVLNLHVEISGCNAVDAGACGVGKPRKRRTDKHGYAKHQRKQTCNQRLFCVHGFHVRFSPSTIRQRIGGRVCLKLSECFRHSAFF